MNPVIEVQGSSYEQGVAEGKLLKEAILRNLDTVFGRLEKSKVDWQKYDHFVEKNAAFLDKKYPELIQEMRGIAAGSEVEFNTILRLNIPAHFLADHFSQECSMLLAKGPATADGNTYIVKNRDMAMPFEQAVIYKTYPDGLKLVEVNGCGIVTFPACGMNSYGLAVTNTGFWTDKDPTDLTRVDQAEIFPNAHHLLTSCRNAKEAVEFAKSMPRMNGLNLMMADKSSAFIVETTKDDFYVDEDQGKGLLFRSNHVVSDKFKHLNSEKMQKSSTFQRYARIDEMTKEKYGRLRFQDLMRIMSDHKDRPNCLCRHAEEGYPGQTVSTSLMCVEDFEVWNILDNPCQHLLYAKIG